MTVVIRLSAAALAAASMLTLLVADDTKPAHGSVRAQAAKLVPVALESVSNGCGGGAPSQNPQMLDRVVLSSVPVGVRWTVTFRMACNIHDAGYAGVVVRNPLHGNVVVDYRNVPRKTIDDQFRSDLKLLCQQQLPKKATAEHAMKLCLLDADTYWTSVRVGGRAFFDANPAKAGKQFIGPRDAS